MEVSFHTLFGTKIFVRLFRVVRCREVSVNGASTVRRKKTGATALIQWFRFSGALWAFMIKLSTAMFFRQLIRT